MIAFIPLRAEVRLAALAFAALAMATRGIDAQESAAPSSPSNSTTLIVVVGAGGQEEYAQEFSNWADKWARLAKLQQWNLVTIGGQHASTESSTEQPEPLEKAAVSDAARLEQALSALSLTERGNSNVTESNQPASRLWLVLIGHGTAMGKVAKFNLTGPDVTTTQLKSWLDKITFETVVVDCTSSSAPFLVELSAQNRIVVTATRSGGEINFARFGQYMADAIGDLGADLDHDQEVSLLEAFLKASKETERFYRENSRLATEHALLDDNHDRVGTSASFYVGSIPTTQASQGKAVDGKRAARVILWSSPDGVRLTAEQAAQREQIEGEIDRLRERKGQLAEAEYYQQLESLLVQLSAVYDEAERQ